MDYPQIKICQGYTHNGCGPLAFLLIPWYTATAPRGAEGKRSRRENSDVHTGEQSLIISEVLRMVTEFAGKLGDLSTVVSFAALVANGLIPKLLLPNGPLLKIQVVILQRIKTGTAPTNGCSPGLFYRSMADGLRVLMYTFIRRCWSGVIMPFSRSPLLK